MHRTSTSGAAVLTAKGEEREMYTDEAKMQSEQTILILPLQSEERMVGSNPKSSKEPFGRKKCQGNPEVLQKYPFLITRYRICNKCCCLGNARNTKYNSHVS